MGTQHRDNRREEASVLLVEDDGATRRFLADNLAADGYEPVEAGTIRDAGRLLASRRVDLAIIDVRLPDGDGLRLVEALRTGRTARGSGADVPVLVLSGRTGELDRLRGFERGADDFVAKPFSYPELRARIGALLRRAERRPAGPRLVVGPLELDPVARQAWLDRRPLGLSNKEFSLLYALARDPTRVFTRDELLQQVWGYRARGTTRTLDTHASRLRTKLRAGGGDFVVNVWGVGYRLWGGDRP